MNAYFLSLVASAYLLVGDPVSGLDTVTEALDQTQSTGARYVESELERPRGELLRAAGAGTAEIEAAFRLACQIGRRQEAKALELRAAVELTRWSRGQGATAQRDALRLLEAVYGWFTEGHATPELQEARQLLDDLS